MEIPLVGAVDLTVWVLVPALIFLARVLDVSIGTLRIIFMAKGYRYLAPALGFVEVLIWLVAIRQIFEHLDNWACYVGFAAGFSTGNLVGMMLESRLALGHELLRVITRTDPTEMIAELRSLGHGVTRVAGEGASGPVNIFLSLLPRRELSDVVERVRKRHPNAFFSVEDVRSVQAGVMPPPRRLLMPGRRKGK